MDRLEAMSLVLAVAETGSLAGAARRLRTPVATASRKISDLEAHLHAKLFDRSGRKLALTDAGGTYVAAAKRILADVGEAERAASGEYTAPTGELIMTAPISLGRLHLLPIIAEFCGTIPTSASVSSSRTGSSVCRRIMLTWPCGLACCPTAG